MYASHGQPRWAKTLFSRFRNTRPASFALRHGSPVATSFSADTPAAAESGLALYVPGCRIFGLPGRNSIAARTSARPARAPPGSPPARIFGGVVRLGFTP